MGGRVKWQEQDSGTRRQGLPHCIFSSCKIPNFSTAWQPLALQSYMHSWQLPRVQGQPWSPACPTVTLLLPSLPPTILLLTASSKYATSLIG
jgi:hypothetical protein